jgi:hypothetical protein
LIFFSADKSFFFSLFLFSFLCLFWFDSLTVSCGGNWNELAATKFRENHSIQPYLKNPFCRIYLCFRLPPTPTQPVQQTYIFYKYWKDKVSEGEKCGEIFRSVIFPTLGDICTPICLLILSLSLSLWSNLYIRRRRWCGCFRKQQKEIKLTEGYFKKSSGELLYSFTFFKTKQKINMVPSLL